MFYLGVGMQLFGLAAVGLCFINGLQLGDYGRLELTQLIVGSLVFYVGSFLKKRT